MKENEERSNIDERERRKKRKSNRKPFTFVVKRVYVGRVTVYARDEDEAWERFEKEGWEKGYNTEEYFEIESDDVLEVEEDVVVLKEARDGIHRKYL